MPVTKTRAENSAHQLIQKAEKWAGDGEPLDCRQMADFAIGLVMGSKNMEINPDEEHSEPFGAGFSCGQILTLNNSPENVVAEVGGYIEATLGLIQTELGPDWDPRVELATEANRGNA